MTVEIYKYSELKKLLDKYAFNLSKSLGQNFLTDNNIIEKIAGGLDISTNDLVLEIGPGAGALTVELAKQANEVKSIEIDKNLLPILGEVLQDAQNTEIINQDFMKVDIKALTGGREYKLIGNLPYYITTPIIMKILEEGPKPSNMVFMIQKEVAQRLSAQPGTKAYGAITVAANYYCSTEYLFTVSKEVFLPKPKVDSAVIRMTPYKQPPVKVEDEKTLFAVIKAGFGQRRKTLSNALKQLNGVTADEVKYALANACIDCKRRAETLEIQEFAALSDSVTSILKNKAKL